MSRRKKRPLTVLDDGTIREGSPGTDEHLADKMEVAVGCTGRGSHRRITIGSWDVLGDLDLIESPGSRGDDDSFFEDAHFVQVVGAPKAYLYLPEDRPEKSHFTQPLKCGYCERDMPMTQAKLFRLLRILKSHGVSFLDLSLLDAIFNK